MSANSPSATSRESRLRATGGDFQKGLEWRTVKLIKDKYKIPLILKGIATAEDAAIALDHGSSGIYVSNHGGRQLDHGRGAMHVLPESSARSGAGQRSWSTVRSARSDIVRRLRWVPISSASAACNAGRWRLPAKPGSCGCWSCWKTKSSAPWDCSASRNSPNSTNPICMRQPDNLPDVFSAFPLLNIEPYRY